MVFKDFCENTSLHGWLFVHKTKNSVGRKLWVLFTVGSIAVAGLFLYIVVKDFASATGMYRL